MPSPPGWAVGLGVEAAAVPLCTVTVRLKAHTISQSVKHAPSTSYHPSPTGHTRFTLPKQIKSPRT